MRTKKRVIARINALFALFFLAIISSVIFFFRSDESQTAFADGFNSGSSAWLPVKSVIIYDIRNKTSQTDFTIPLATASMSGDMSALARVDKFQIKLSGADVSYTRSGWGLTFILLSFFSYIAVLVLILIILFSLHKSVRRGNMFEQRNIMRTRVLGLLLLVSSLFTSFALWMENGAVAGLLKADPAAGFVVDTALNFSFSEIITSILIMFIAEVFAIGYSLSEEQKLTI